MEHLVRGCTGSGTAPALVEHLDAAGRKRQLRRRKKQEEAAPEEEKQEEAAPEEQEAAPEDEVTKEATEPEETGEGIVRNDMNNDDKCHVETNA